MLARTLLWLAVPTLALAPSSTLAQAPEQARLMVGQDTYNIPIGKAFAVKIGGERVTMRLDLSVDRTFSESGVSFTYPSTLQPQAPSGAEGSRVWTLQGKSAAVVVQQYEAGLDAKSLRDVLMENLVQREGAKAAKPQAVKLSAGGRSFEGAQLRSERPAQGALPATVSVENVFTFTNDQGVFALIVQDVHPQGEKESAEYEEALKLISESLDAGQAPAPPKPAAARR